MSSLFSLSYFCIMILGSIIHFRHRVNYKTWCLSKVIIFSSLLFGFQNAFVCQLFSRIDLLILILLYSYCFLNLFHLFSIEQRKDFFHHILFFLSPVSDHVDYSFPPFFITWLCFLTMILIFSVLMRLLPLYYVLKILTAFILGFLYFNLRSGISCVYE